MRRPLLVALIALGLAAVLAAASLLAASRLGPEQVRAAAERSLGRALGGAVSVASARLLLQPLPAFEVEGLAAWAEPGKPALRVRRALGRVDPSSLLLGRIRLRRILLEDAVLQLERRPDGSWVTVPVLGAALGDDAPAPQASSGRFAWIERMGDRARSILQAPLNLLRASLAPQQLELHGARFVLTDRSVAPDAPWLLALEDFEALLVQNTRARTSRIAGSGRLVDPAGETGWITLEGSRTRDGRVEVTFDARHVDLRAFAPYLRATHPDLRLAGTARGSAALHVARDRARSLRLDLLVGNLDARFPRAGAEAPLRLRGKAAVAAAEIELTDDRLRLEDASLELDGERISARGVVERPLRAGSRARLTLETENVQIERARDFADWLPDEMAEALAGPLARLEAGRLTHLEVHGTGRLRDWAELSDPSADRLPLQFEGNASFRDVTVRVDPDEAIEGLAGQIRLDRERLEVRNLKRAEDMPELDFEIVGLERLLARGERGAAAPAPEIPGIGPLTDFMAGDGQPRDPARPIGLERLEVHADWLDHPIATWRLEDVDLVVEPPVDGARALRASGWWGGLAVEADGQVVPRRGDDPGRVAVTLVVGEQEREMAPSSSLGIWARGTWRAEGGRFVGVGLPDPHGGFYCQGTQLRLVDAESSVQDGGRVHGTIEVDLAREDQVPLDLELVLEDTEFREVGQLLGLDRGDLEARVDAVVDLDGSLEPGRKALRTLAGGVSLNAGEGALHRRPPMAGAIARSGDRFQEFAAEGSLPFDALRSDLALAGGRIATDALLFEAPRLRILISGSLQVDERPNDLEVVIGIFPHSTVDTIVGKLPIVGPLLQGPDEKLVAAYLEATGPWREPQIRSISGPSFASDPKILVPKFVRRGLAAIQSALARLGPRAGSPPPEGS